MRENKVDDNMIILKSPLNFSNKNKHTKVKSTNILDMPKFMKECRVLSRLGQVKKEETGQE